MRKNVLFVVSITLMLLPLQLTSQSATTIASGDRVRLSARSLGTESRVGILTKVEDGKLMLVDPNATRTPWEISLDRVDGLEVRVVNAGDHRHQGALIGMLFGIVSGGIIGYYATKCPNGCDFDRMGVVAAGPVGGLGAYFGYQIGKNQKADGWVRVPLPLKVGLASESNKNLRFTGSIAFR